MSLTHSQTMNIDITFSSFNKKHAYIYSKLQDFGKTWVKLKSPSTKSGIMMFVIILVLDHLQIFSRANKIAGTRKIALQSTIALTGIAC